MNPLAVSLLVLGYGLSFPIGFRMLQIVRNQNRWAFTGHQVGVIFAALGWFAKGSFVVVLLHVAWLIGTRVWFQYAGMRRRSRKPSK